MTNDSVSAKLIDTTYYSIGFPIDTKDILIGRDNYLSQIDDYITQGAKLLLIDGEDDSGKTTLCTQIAKRNPHDVITVFFNPLNNIDYTIEYYCANVVFQLKYLLKENFDIEEIETVTKEEYNKYIFNIRKALKKGNRQLILILDGLEQKLKEKSDFIRDLISIIPIGHEFFTVIMTGTEQDLKNLYPKGKAPLLKHINLTGLSEPEIVKYLNSDGFSINQNREIYKITKGFPGRLKTLKRLLTSENYTLDKITTTTTYKNWIELDCNNVDLSIHLNNGIISLFALTDKSYPSEEIAKIYSIEPDKATEVLENITVFEKSNKFFRFISTEHKRYFSNILRGNKRSVQDLLISYYGNNDSINSLIELPKLLAETSEWSKIISIINEDYSRRIIQNTESIKYVNDGLALGLLASEKTNRQIEMWRYSLEGSIVNELDSYLFWESEVKARISLKDFEGAIFLAESAVLKVDRLRLLALIARREKEVKDSVNEDLVKLIIQLYETTELISVGEKIYDIVADLIYAIPNLAIEMIEKASDTSSEKNINDWVIAKLSMAAIDSSIKDNIEIEKSKAFEAIQSLTNVDVDKINKSILFLVGNYSPSKVIDEVKKLSDSTERLRFLRLWLTNYRSTSGDIASVIELALNEMVTSSSEVSVTMDIMKELSHQLPYVKDPNLKDKLYFRFKNIENNLLDLGLSRNRYIYKLNLFHAEFTLDSKNATSSLDRILRDIERLPDILTKLESFAESYSKLNMLGANFLLKKINYLQSKIIELTKTLFDSSGDHLKLITYTLRTVSKTNPLLGLEICDLINLESRREAAKSIIAESYLDNNLKFIGIETLKVLERSFLYEFRKNDFYIKILERYSESKSLHFSIINHLLYFIDKAKGFRIPPAKTLAYILGYKIIAKNEDQKNKHSKRLQTLIKSSWQEIEAEWDRIDIGFTICSDISHIDFSFAKDVFAQVIELKNASWIDSIQIADAYLNSMRIVIRSFVSLLSSGKASAEDEKIVSDLMNRIPSEIRRVDLWTELGFLSCANQQDSYAKKIYNDHIIPLLEGIIGKQIDLSENLDTLTYIHLYFPEQTVKYMKHFDEIVRHEVFSNICDYYVTKRNPYDIYDRHIKDFESNYTDLNKAVAILDNIDRDVIIFEKVDLICRSIQISKNNITRTQAGTILENLEALCKRKLPDLKNIKHNGFKILADAKITKAKRDFNNHSSFWQSILDEAGKIPNKSDLVFVYALLLNEIPFEKMNNGVTAKQKVYENIIENLNGLNTKYEFVQRVIDISEYMFNASRSGWKEIINKAFLSCSDLPEGKETYSYQKEIIDTMYRMDSEFTKELINLIDSEGQENRYLKYLRRNIEILEISKKIKENKTIEDKTKENYYVFVQGVVNAYRGLNSGTATPKKLHEISPYLTVANKLPLRKSLPIYLFYLTNCLKTYGQKNMSGTLSNLHMENFRKAVKSTNLIEILSNKKRSQEAGSGRRFFMEDHFHSNKVVRPGTREEALAFIKEWMTDQLTDFIIIADPFFSKEDLYILKTIKEIDSSIDIDILGSQSGQDQNLEASYKSFWKSISDEDPPFTNITFCWTPDQGNLSPFHDRWIITKESGLRMGTSLNSLGKGKDSELSIMKPSEAENIKENILREYIERKKRSYNNLRIAYKSFSL